MHSAWIGEHHFDSLGVNSRPDLLLANIASQTKNIRLAPAVTVLPLHHPVHVAEMWATLDLLSGGRVDFATGRGYDRKEYAPFGADFMASAEIFEEGIDVLLKAWNSPGKWSHKGRFYDIPEMAITPAPGAEAAAFLRRVLLQDEPRHGGEARPQHHLCAVRRRHGVRRARQGGRELPRGLRARRARSRAAPCAATSSTSPTTPRQEDYGRETQMDYFNHCVLQAFPQKKEDAPPTMQYFLKIVDILKNMKKEDLSDKSILLGSPQKIIDTLKKVEASGIDEVILYFNVGNKPHSLVKEQMHRFMEEIAPHFEGKHIERMKEVA